MTTHPTTLVGSRPIRVVYLVSLLVIAVALAAGSIAGGTRLLAQASDEPAVPAPFGPARNGLIAYDSLGDIWVVEPDGSEPRQLTNGPALDFSPVWSPDGARIAYWSIPDAVQEGASAEAFSGVADAVRESPADLIVMDGDGTEARPLMTGVRRTRWESLPHWAPSSDRLVLASLDLANVPSIAVVEMDGAVALLPDAHGEDPVWSPDGLAIAYKGGDALPRCGVMVQPLTDGGTEPAQVAGTGCSEWAYWEPQWEPLSPSRRIAFYDPDFDIRVVDVTEDGAALEGSERVIASDPSNEYFPMWSPDGRTIAFVRVVDSAQNLTQAVLVDPDGSHERVLASPPLWGTQVTWSPDGTLLLGAPPGPDLGPNDETLLLDAVGTHAPTSIATPSEVGFASWQRLAPDAGDGT